MSSKGFTMTELMVTIAVISVVSLIAFPALLSQMPKMRLNHVVRGIAQEMYLAKLRSVSNNKELRLVITNNEYPVPDSYHFERNDGAWTVITDEKELPKESNIYKVTFPLSRCEFNPNGTTSSGGIYFRLGDTDDGSCKITTTASLGKVNVRRP